MTFDNQTTSIPNNVGEIDYLSAMSTGHRLAVSAQDAWGCHVAAPIRDYLVEVQREIRPRSFDESFSFDVLKSNLCDLFKDRIAGHADEMFSHDFVQQSGTEIVTMVANALPNNIAANYDFEALRRSLLEIVGDFANHAKELPRWKTKRFRKGIQKKAVNIEVRSGAFGVMSALIGAQAKKEIKRGAKHSIRAGGFILTKKTKKKIVYFARDQIGLLIDDLKNLAKDTEGKLVDAVLSIPTGTKG